MDYDWDSVQVGRPELNSSQNFFRVRHVLHEKGVLNSNDAHLEEQKNKESNIPEKKPEKSTTVTNIVDTKICKAEKENVSSINYNNRAILAVSIIKKPMDTNVKNTTLLNNLKKLTLSQKSGVPVEQGKQRKTAKSASIKCNNNDRLKAGKFIEPLRAPVIKKPIIGQRQFEYAEVQKKRKELLVQKIKEQEAKELKFQFHANPAPNLKKKVPNLVSIKQKSVEEKPNKQKTLVKQKSLPCEEVSKKISKENNVPSCGDPERLKLLNEKKKMLVAKYQEKPIQFKAKPALVLKKQPFQPIHNNNKIVDPKPFNLHLTDRLIMRSEFDRKLHETIAIRKKQEEIRVRQQTLEERKLIRQKTEFKARINPFRNRH
ncbi:CLUMA_CG003243, isoform B [Clunio marinus]|nr:CLUMA_CG003243, isoform B [Clunio marinus]